MNDQEKVRPHVRPDLEGLSHVTFTSSWGAPQPSQEQDQEDQDDDEVEIIRIKAPEVECI